MLVFFLLLSTCALSPSRGVPATLVLLHDAVNTVGKIIEQCMSPLRPSRKIIVQRSLAIWRATNSTTPDY